MTNYPRILYNHNLPTSPLCASVPLAQRVVT
jgi:hypothetical protein